MAIITDFWRRLLSSNPEAAKAVVLSERMLIRDDSDNLDPVLLDQLISNMSSAASIYHKPPEVSII